MLSLFDNETENGKLYISYPMVEALWHIADYSKFHELKVKCKGSNCAYRNKCGEYDRCKEEPHYKTVVNKQCIPQLVNINKYDVAIWKELITAHICKMNYIVAGNCEFPAKVIGQIEVFGAQFSKYINKQCPEVAVLNAFPIFIHDYYGNDKTKKMFESS
jgi:hypothetical protein